MQVAHDSVIAATELEEKPGVGIVELCEHGRLKVR